MQQQRPPRHIIRHVEGNPLRLVIPMTACLRVLQPGGTEEQSLVDFIPSPDYPVYLRLSVYGKLKYAYQASVADNVATADLGTQTRLGTYELELTCHDQDGQPRRYMARDVLQVVSATAEALRPTGGTMPTVGATEHLLEAAVYIYTKGDKGDPGNGIERMEQVQESHTSGGINTWRMTMTDGQTADFNVRNGEKVAAEVDEPDENLILR